MLPGRYDAPGVLASGSGLAASALESPSILVLTFHSSLSFVEGSSDGLAASVRALLDGCVSLTPFELSRLCAISLCGLAFLYLGLTVDFCWIQWRRSSRKLMRFPCGWGLSVLSLDRVLLTAFLSSPGRSCPGLSWLPLMGFDFAGLVVWLLLAMQSLSPPSHSTVCSLRHILVFVRCELGSPLVPSPVAVLLG